MGKQKVVYIQETLVEELEKRATKKFVKPGTYVNDLLRWDFQGRPGVVAAGPAQKEPIELEDGTIKTKACSMCDDGVRSKPNLQCGIEAHKADGPCYSCHTCEGTGQVMA